MLATIIFHVLSLDQVITMDNIHLYFRYPRTINDGWEKDEVYDRKPDDCDVGYSRRCTEYARPRFSVAFHLMPLIRV